MRPGRRRRSAPVLTAPAAVVVTWLAARTGMALLYLADDFVGRSLAWGDLRLFELWATQVRATGAMPDMVFWMYPPLAAFVLSGAEALPAPFGPSWVLLMLLVDLAVLVLLLRSVRLDRGHPAGAWAWALLVPLLGLLPWARLDLLPVAAAAGALLLAGRRPALAGALAALGTALKAWPVLLGLLFLRSRRWLVGAVVTGLGVALASTLLLDDTWGFVANLSGRGLQVESAVALPWTLQQALGGAVDGDFVNGTYEILEPGAGAAARVFGLVVPLAVAGAWWLSRHRGPALRWYAMVSALLVTSPLLSTQFMLWLVGAAAVASTVQGADGALARRSLPVVALVVAVSHLTFPLQWAGLVGDGALAAATLLGRNLLLLGLAGWLLTAVALRPSGTPAPRPAAPAADEPSRPSSRPDAPSAGRFRPTAPVGQDPPAGR